MTLEELLNSELSKGASFPIRVRHRNWCTGYFFEILEPRGSRVFGCVKDSSGSRGNSSFHKHTIGWTLYDDEKAKAEVVCECGKDKHGFAMHSQWCAKYER